MGVLGTETVGDSHSARERTRNEDRDCSMLVLNKCGRRVILRAEVKRNVGNPHYWGSDSWRTSKGPLSPPCSFGSI